MALFFNVSVLGSSVEKSRFDRYARIVACTRMVKPRIAESGQELPGVFDVKAYDRLVRRLRDRGWIETDLILRTGISQGLALEIGSGPGYLGLEWLKKTEGTNLRALDISPKMLMIAKGNAREYGIPDRVSYIKGDAQEMPFSDGTFDGVFSSGSLHEWSQPKKVFNEIRRVLKPGGRCCIIDLRRDMSPLVKCFIKLVAKPKEMKPWLVLSINASYTLVEVQSILGESDLRMFKIRNTATGLVITGVKQLQFVQVPDAVPHGSSGHRLSNGVEASPARAVRGH